MFEEKFQGDLQRDERILWTGQPRLRITMHRETWRYTAAAVFFLVFLLILPGEPPDLVQAWHSPIRAWNKESLWFFGRLFAGALLFFGPPIIEFLRKPWIYYAVTNRRLLILYDYGHRTVRSWIIATVPKLERTTGLFGRGTLRFGEVNKDDGLWPFMHIFGPWPHLAYEMLLLHYSLFSKRGIPGFADITDVDHVYRLIASIRGPD